jgi:O-acetyl-ADP-ribose deacetylase (regulator of RNase III)/DNA-binding XRE family transcriptional regulator
MHVDAVVNTANVKLQQGKGGVSGAIFEAAGVESLREACLRIGGCAFGNAVVTPGFNLPAAHIIHTPSMVWIDGFHSEEAVLRSCYQACLRLAAFEGYGNVAFPLIGSGAHGYPKQLALTVATQEINSFLLAYDGDMTVYLAVFGHRAFALSKKLADEVHEYIDDHYVDERPDRRRRLTEADYMMPMMAEGEKANDFCMSAPPESEIATEPPFAQVMMKYIDSHHMTDPEVYNRANITKQSYFKIKTEKCRPKKPTALALCVAMKLTLQETIHFLQLAGYALSPSSRQDLIVQYFISRNIYNVFEINSVLFDQGFEKYQLGSAEK